MASVPADWLPDAIDPPRALGAPAARGRLRATPEDFIVEEQLGFAPDGDGPHWLLHVRKRGANTEFVARVLATQARVPPFEVGFAGLKDRHALTSQWFTVPRGKSSAADWLALRHEEFAVLEAHAHRRKLKRGALSANAFRIRIRELRGDREALRERMAQVGAMGVPNYFGAQRFGRDAANIALALRWAESGRAPQARSQRAFALSAARSLIFNAVLAKRVRRGDWGVLAAGDVANLHGSGSVFAVSEPDSELHARALALDLHPTGPMWGAGESMAAGAVRELELASARAHAPLPTLLEQAGLSAERRSLRIPVAELTTLWQGEDLQIAFRLPAGAFATTVLRELIEGDGHD